MKKKIFKRGMAGLLAVLTAFTTLIGMGTTAFAASETAESYMVSYPRDGDAVQVYDHSTWGHDAKTYMNGWSTGASDMTTIHCMDSYDGKVCYNIDYQFINDKPSQRDSLTAMTNPTVRAEILTVFKNNSKKT